MALPAPPNQPPAAPDASAAVGLTPPPVAPAAPVLSDDQVVERIVQKAKFDPIMLSLQKDKNFMRADPVRKAQMWTAADPRLRDPQDPMDEELKLRAIYQLFAVSEGARLSRRETLINQANENQHPQNGFWHGVGNAIKAVPAAIEQTFDNATTDSGLAGSFAKTMAEGEVQSRKDTFGHATDHLMYGDSPEERGVGALGAAIASVPVPMAGYVGDFPHRMFEGEPLTVAGETAGNVGMAYAGGAASKLVGKVMPEALADNELIRTKTTSERSGGHTIGHAENLLERSLPGAGVYGRVRAEQAAGVVNLLRQNFVEGLKNVVRLKPQDRGAAIQQMLSTYKNNWTDQFQKLYQTIDDESRPVAGQRIGANGKPEDYFAPGAHPVELNALRVDGKPFGQWAEEMSDLEAARKQYGMDVGPQVSEFAQKMMQAAEEDAANGGTPASLVRQLRDTEVTGVTAKALKPVRDQLTKALHDTFDSNGRQDLSTLLDAADNLRDKTQIFDRKAFQTMLDNGTAKETIPYMLGKLSVEDLNTVKSLTLGKSGGGAIWRQWVGSWFEREMMDNIVKSPEAPAKLKANAGDATYKFLADLDADGRLESMLGKSGRAKAFQFAKELRQLNLSGQDGSTAMGVIPAISAVFGGPGVGAGIGAVSGGVGGAVAGAAIGGAAVAGGFTLFRVIAYALAHPEVASQFGKMLRGLSTHNAAAANAAALVMMHHLADKNAEKDTVPQRAYQWFKKTTTRKDKTEGIPTP